MTDKIIVLCTTPDETSAEQLSRRILEQKLAACITLLPGATSFYMWEGKLEKSHETQMLIKSNTTSQSRLLNNLKQYHPYDVPELLVLPVQDGDPEYLSWLDACLS